MLFEHVNTITGGQRRLVRANAAPIDQVLELIGESVGHSGKLRCFLKGHEGDNTPSLQVYSGTNTFYCFGCKKGGKPVDLIANYYGIPKMIACEKLENLLGIQYSPEDDSLEFTSKFSNLSNKFKGLLIPHDLDSSWEGRLQELEEGFFLEFHTMKLKTYEATSLRNEFFKTRDSKPITEISVETCSTILASLRKLKNKNNGI